MKKFKFITLAIAILGFTSISFAQNPVSVAANSNAAVKIIAPISIERGTDDLDFGTIAISSVDQGTITVDVLGLATKTGGLTIPAGSTSKAADFTVSGEADLAFSIQLPADGEIILGTNMPISDWKHTNVTQLTNGSATFKVGATLTVPASTAAGTYSKEFPVTVSYN